MLFRSNMNRFSYLKKLPKYKKSKEGCSFPDVINGLFWAIRVQEGIFKHSRIKNYPIIAIEQRHKDASYKISSCIYYIAMISFRLRKTSSCKTFQKKDLDWESFIIFSQILLDSFSVLVPVFYGISPEFKRTCPICQKIKKKSKVSSFNSLRYWITQNKIKDDFVKKYKKAREKNTGWYWKINKQRQRFTHKNVYQSILPKGSLGKQKKDLLFYVPKKDGLFGLKILDKEFKEYIKSIFNFLTFSGLFFRKILKKRGIQTREKDLFNFTIIGEHICCLNDLLN